MSTDKRPGLMLLRIAGTSPPVHLLVDQPFYEHNEAPGAKHDDHQRYWVETHTCPTNIVPVASIIWMGDADPHGVLEYVGHVLKPDDWTDGCENDIAAIKLLFPASDL